MGSIFTYKFINFAVLHINFLPSLNSNKLFFELSSNVSLSNKYSFYAVDLNFL